MSAVLMAALDGMQNRIDPGPPLDKDIYDLQPEELDEFPKTPDLAGGIAARLCESDHDFLLRGDVFTEDVIDTWIWYKQTHESRPCGSGRTRGSLRCTTMRDRAANREAANVRSGLVRALRTATSLFKLRELGQILEPLHDRIGRVGSGKIYQRRFGPDLLVA